MIRTGSAITRRMNTRKVRRMRTIQPDATRTRGARATTRTRHVERNMKVYTNLYHSTEYAS